MPQETAERKTPEEKRKALMLLIFPGNETTRVIEKTTGIKQEFKKYKFIKLDIPGEFGGMTAKKIMQLERKEWEKLTEKQQEQAMKNAHAQGFEIEVVKEIA